MIKEMKELMLAKMNKYYGKGYNMEVLNKAMLLDPQFKNVSFMSSDILFPELIYRNCKVNTYLDYPFLNLI